MTALEMGQDAFKILVLKRNYEMDAAKHQAEKKKLNAFGLMSKFNLLKRPTDDTVHLQNQTLRYEPFWYYACEREVVYDHVVTYSVPVANPHAQSIEVRNDAGDAPTFNIMGEKDKRRIDVEVTEKCRRKIAFDNYLDGLKRDIKVPTLANYTNKNKFKYSEIEQSEIENALIPLIPKQAVEALIGTELQKHVINASRVHEDRETITKLHLFYRPVYAFQFSWGSADKLGVIEVDGLTGELIENGNWFQEGLDRALTRENLISLSGDVAGALLPGSGTVVRMAAEFIPPSGR